MHPSDNTPPVLRGIDHVGVTVRDIDAATTFFEQAFGARLIYQSLGHGEPPQRGDALEADTGVAPGTVMRSQRVLQIGDGPDIELFEMEAPDQRPSPRGSDIGINHLAFYADDPEAAIARFERAGGRMRSPPRELRFAAERGARNSFCYGLTPWGMSVEFIAYPDPMPYRDTTALRRWHDRRTHEGAEPAEVLRRFYAAESAYMVATDADFSPIAALLDPDCVIVQPDSLPYGGEWRGHKGFERWMRAFAEAWARLEVSDPEIHDCGGGIVVSRSQVHAVAKRTGRSADWPLLQFFRLRQGRIAELRPFYWDTAAALLALSDTQQSEKPATGSDPSRL